MADEVVQQADATGAEPASSDVPVAEVPEVETAQLPEVESPVSDAPDDGAEDELPMTEEEVDEARANEVAFSWQASEYVHHHKGAGWYLMLFCGLAILVMASILFKLWLQIGLILAMGGAIMVYASKPPRTLMYELTPTGIVIDGLARPFTEFRSFGVLTDEEWHTIDLEPTKRFSLRLSILFDPDDFDDIVGHLDLHLPRADRDPDPIEKLSRYLRF